MSRARKKIQIMLGCISLFIAPILSAQTWQPLTSGIEYVDLNTNTLSLWSHIHVFRVNLHDQQLALAFAKDLPEHEGSAQAFHRYTHAMIAINGGFFNPERLPIGLRISDYQLLNPIKPISWWGVFAINSQKATITAHSNFHRMKETDFAIQSGPRLLISKRIPTLKPGYANRSALGIDKKGRVIMLVTENMPLTTTELAKIMQAKPLDCIDALNLDGGSSSQLYAQIDKFNLDVPGFSQVSDAIVVKPRH